MDPSQARVALEEPVAAEAKPRIRFDHVSIEVLVGENRGGVAEARIKHLRVVAVLGFAGAQPVAQPELAAGFLSEQS